MGLNDQDRAIMQIPRMATLTERNKTTMINGTMAGPIWHSLGSFYNLETRDPTTDVRLLNFCMDVPDDQYTFEGDRRMLIRRAMTRILPENFRLNVKRSKQAADIIPRLVEQNEELKREMDCLGSEPKVINYIDVSEMKNTWNSLITDSTNIVSASTSAILNAMKTGDFLL